ncbi:MAG: response regulator [candidate division Zixibacteria bacterium]|nr:response regulator [candidate division Zixibacteria bacterium]
MVDNNHNPGDNNLVSILVIDDSPIMRGMLTDILTDDGYLVDSAEDGEIGVAMALKKDYAVIISDVHMPKKNGLETVRDIIAAKPYSKIILTDSFPDKLATAAKKEGAACCLQKPFDVNELRQVIREIHHSGKVSIG